MRTPHLLILALLVGCVQPLQGCATTLGPPDYLDISTSLAPAPFVSQDSLQHLRAEQLFVRGMTYLMMDEPARAQSFFGEALELTPDEPAIYSALADVAVALDDPITAVYYAEQAVRRAADETAYLMQLATVQRSAGRPDAARATLDRLLALDPTHRRAKTARTEWSDGDAPRPAPDPPPVVMRMEGPGAQETLEDRYARAVADVDARPEAVAALEAAVSEDPAPRDLYMLGHLYFLDDRFAEAAGPLGRSVDLEPRLIEAWAPAVTANRRAGNVDRAAELSEEGRLLFPNDPPLLLADIDLALDQGESDRASAHLAELARLLDDTDDVLWEATRNAADRVLAVRPNDPRALYASGWAAHHLGDAQAALARLEQATVADPSDATAQHHLGDLLMASGDWVGALGAWAKALEGDLENPVIVEKIKQTVEQYGPPPASEQ